MIHVDVIGKPTNTDIEARDIRRLIVKNNEQTQTENSEKDKQ